MINKKKIWRGIKGNVLFILGSFILVFSWYNENNTIINIQSDIDEAKENLIEYRRIELTIIPTRIAYKQELKKIKPGDIFIADDLIELAHQLNISYNILNYLTALAAAETFQEKVNAHYELQRRQEILRNMGESKQIDSVLAVLNRFEDNFYEKHLNHQKIITQRIKDLENDLKKTRFAFIFLYAFGVTLITADKIKNYFLRQKDVNVSETLQRIDNKLTHLANPKKRKKSDS